MTDAHADAELLVRAVDQVARRTQGELERAERVVRSRREHRRQNVTLGGMLGTDRRRRCPGRIRKLPGDGGAGDRRAPAFAPDPHREGMHHVLTLGVVVHAVLGQVDHDAFARPRRQHEAGRQDDIGPLARQPRIDARIGGDHFQIAEVVGRADVGEGVLVLGLDHLHLADDILAGRWQRQFERAGGCSQQQCGQAGQHGANGDNTGEHRRYLNLNDH
ncbi:hypothetical protein D3C78_1168530 [compost metagenome]